MYVSQDGCFRLHRKCVLQHLFSDRDSGSTLVATRTSCSYEEKGTLSSTKAQRAVQHRM